MLNYFPQEGELFYFWKGRVGLYLALQALGISQGDEVILPGFSCVVVPNAVLYAGAKPVYADIDPYTYNVTAESIRPLITARTRAIIVQNTFGLSADLDPILALVHEKGLPVIEDCAHGLGGSYRGQPNGTLGDVAFFSSQWSKPISTGVGGIVYTRSRQVIDYLHKQLPNLEKPSAKQQTLLAAQLLVRPLADQPLLHYPTVALYRFMTQRMGLSVGSSSGDELATTTMPGGYLRQMGGLQKAWWQRGMKNLPKLVAKRRSVAAFYDQYLQEHNIGVPYQPNYALHAMLRYPVRVAEKQRVLEAAKRKQIPLGDWFNSPLHPVQEAWQRWGYEPGQCPIAEQACNELINLFTDHPLTRKQLDELFAS